jgi:hypothetical protein
MGINVAGGTLTIPNATANNQPVALGQLLIDYISTSYPGTGYLKIPNSTNPSYPTIIQWFNVQVTANGNNASTFNLPLAFPNAALTGFLTNQGTSDGSYGTPFLLNISTTQVSIANPVATSGTTADMNVLAIGY